MVIFSLFIIGATVATLCAVKGPRVFVVFLLAAGVVRFGVEGMPGGMNLSALWLAGLISLTIMTQLSAGQPRIDFSAPEKAYLLFLAWCALEACRADSVFFALRVFLKLLYPFLVMVLARRSIRDDRDLRSCLRWTLFVALSAFLVHGGFTLRLAPVIVGRTSSLVWPFAAFTDYSSLMAILALVYWRVSGRTRYLVLCLLLGISNVLHANRTGVAALAIGLTVWLFLCTKRRVAVPLATAVYGVAVVSLFVWGEEHMFVSGSQVDPVAAAVNPASVDLETINSSGRREMWDDLLAQFFWPQPLWGSGLGATQAWFREDYGHHGAMVEHSAYVRLLSDTGLIGLGLFVATLLCCVMEARRVYLSTNSSTTKACSAFVIASVPATLVIMGFDTAINCATPVMQYPFAFTGITLALAFMPRPRAPRALVRLGDAAPARAAPDEKPGRCS